MNRRAQGDYPVWNLIPPMLPVLRGGSKEILFAGKTRWIFNFVDANNIS